MFHKKRLEKALWKLRLYIAFFRYSADDRYFHFNKIRRRCMPVFERLFRRRPVISIRLMDALGDMIFQLPTLEALRQKYPHFRIQAIAPYSRQTGSRELLERCPFIDEIADHASPWARVSIDVHHFFAGLKVPTPLSPTGERPGISREHLYFKIAQFAGVPISAVHFPHVALPVSEERQAELSRLFQLDAPSVVRLGFEIFCKGGRQFKQWDLNSFRESFRLIKIDFPQAHLFSITREPYAGFDDLEVRNISGLSLAEVAWVMSRLQCVVVLQSGLGALAGAMDLNVIQMNGGAPLGWSNCISPKATIVDQILPWDINSIRPKMLAAEVQRRLKSLGHAPVKTSTRFLRLAFLNYCYLPDYYGPSGGHWVNRAMISEGRRRGHEIIPFNPSDAARLTYDYDAFLLGDIYGTPPDLINFPLRTLDSIMSSGIPYITFDNGFSVCEIFDPPIPCLKVKDRNVESIAREISVCGRHAFGPIKTPRSCALGHAQRLYKKASLSAFMSPMQKEIYDRLLGEGRPGQSYIAGPLSCDPALFRPDPKIHRKSNRYVCVGSISKIKGYANVRQALFDKPNIEIVFAGKMNAAMTDEFRRDQKMAKAKVIYQGILPRHELPALYSSAAFFVHLPDFPEPFGLGAVEASLCGCELVVNANVGAASWDRALNNQADIERCPERLWDTMESVIGQRSPSLLRSSL